MLFPFKVSKGIIDFFSFGSSLFMLGKYFYFKREPHSVFSKGDFKAKKRSRDHLMIKIRLIKLIVDRKTFINRIKKYMPWPAFSNLTFLLLIISLPFSNTACLAGYDDPVNIVKNDTQEPELWPVNSTEDDLGESRSIEGWNDDSLIEEPDTSAGTGHDDFAADIDQFYQHDLETLERLDNAVEAWIDQNAADNLDINRYNYYLIDTIDHYEAVVIVGMCCSEPEYLLEYEMVDGWWRLNQARATPHSGYDVIREIGNSLERLIDLYGSPNRLIEIKELDNSYYMGEYYYYYDHLMTGFIVGGELPLVQGVELLGHYYCFSVAVGDMPENLNDKLGEPTSHGYSKEADKEGYPSYVRYYKFPEIEEHLRASGRYGLLEYLLPEYMGYLGTYVFSESEYSAVKIILVTTKPLQ